MVQIISTLASADPANTFGDDLLPDFKNVIARYSFGATEASSLMNRVTGVAAAKIGQPAWQNGYAEMGYTPAGINNGLTTDVSCPNAVSVIAVIRQVTNANPPIMAVSGRETEFNLVMPSQTRFSSGNGHVYGATDQAYVDLPANGNAGSFSLVMGVGILATPSRVFLRTASGTIMDDGGVQYLPNTRTTNPFQIGGMIDNQASGIFDITDLIIIAGALGQTFLDAIYPRVAAKLAASGLPLN